jgi:hypothetical protein
MDFGKSHLVDQFDGMGDNGDNPQNHAGSVHGPGVSRKGFIAQVLLASKRGRRGNQLIEYAMRVHIYQHEAGLCPCRNEQSSTNESLHHALPAEGLDIHTGLGPDVRPAGNRILALLRRTQIGPFGTV